MKNEIRGSLGRWRRDPRNLFFLISAAGLLLYFLLSFRYGGALYAWTVQENDPSIRFIDYFSHLQSVENPPLLYHQIDWDALAIRCWNEMEQIMRVCPCVLLSELNDRGIATSCEIDLTSAISMRAMQLASEQPTAVLDWNNNYGDEENKVILFHCGSTAKSLMTDSGHVTSHKMFDKNDPGSGWGTNEGRIRPMDTTISNCLTVDGKIKFYASEGRFTDDPIEDAYFGCAGVCEIPDLENKLIRLARGGFKHHTCVGVGHMKHILKEAMTVYLGYDWVEID